MKKHLTLTITNNSQIGADSVFILHTADSVRTIEAIALVFKCSDYEYGYKMANFMIEILNGLIDTGIEIELRPPDGSEPY